MDDLKPPSDPARAVAAMLGKLDESDKDTFNWLIGLARYQPRADAKPAYQCPTCNRHGERTSRCFHGPEGSEIPDVKPEAPAPMGDAATDDATVNERAIDIVRRLARVGGCALPVGIIFDAGSDLVYDARALVALMARDGTDTTTARDDGPDSVPWCVTCEREVGAAAIRHDDTHDQCGTAIDMRARDDGEV